jgi:hypothetical protein
MKHLRKINEWKSESDSELDADNIRDLEDVFLPIKDMGCDNFQIIVDNHISESYNVKWDYQISLSIGSYPEKVTSESIKNHKERVSLFSKFQEETHEVLETLLNMDYEIAYYSVNLGVDTRANSVFKFEIRIGKKED